MGTPTVLGLDIGGANLKAATTDRRAVSAPFALWQQPDKLPAALAELVGQFPDAGELAVTMTGELCDCFETKREGVNAIITAVLNVSRSRPVRVWSTDGAFLNSEEARCHYLKVAAANWHALATLAGQYAPDGPALLVDVGSTTTDIIPLRDGKPATAGTTDPARLANRELVYTGVRRTPLCALLGATGAAEFFATTLDVYLSLGLIPEDPADTDTADRRPATRPYAQARLARMLCGDADTIPPDEVTELAERVRETQIDWIASGVRRAVDRLTDVRVRERMRPIVSGSGEFLARAVIDHCASDLTDNALSLNEVLGPAVSACAPAYAVAVLADEVNRRRGGRADDPRVGVRTTRGLWPWSGS
ncbi:MAG TPA: hydantoinase/oxoprolinase family protein [Urbifossiella sp.]|jgi:hypothetical protein|nr:hydantoinase/oxoprolinase family protein [Urbifossiella sp.]